MLDSRSGFSDAPADLDGGAPAGHDVPPVGTFHDFTGTHHDDTFVGTNGDDSFDLSQGGNDTVHGRDGNDTIVFEGGGFNAGDQLNGGPGGNQVVFSSVFSGPSDYSAGVVFGPTTMQGIGLLTLQSGQFNFTLDDANLASGAALMIVLEPDDSTSRYEIDASSETDADIAFLYFSFAGTDDTLLTGGGNDFFQLDGGGTDIVDGGGGYDVVDFFQSFDTGVTVSLALQGAPQDVGGGRMVTLNHIEGITGTPGKDVLTGDGNDNFIMTTGGNDIVHAGAGNDLVRIYPTVSGDSSQPPVETYHVVTDGGDGIDCLMFSFDWESNFPDVTEGVTFSLALQGTNQTVGDHKTVRASNFENASGTIFADALSGDGQRNALYGDAGDDTLSGGAGDDSLFGDKGFWLAWDAQGNIAGPGENDHQADDTPFGPGNDTLFGGAGNDTLDGGLGADAMNGGSGSDIFLYGAVVESMSSGFDTITGFDAAADIFDLPFSVTAVDAKIKAGTLSDATFNHDLAAAVDGAHLGRHHAVLFTPKHGDHALETFLIIDANGRAGYQAGEDLVVRLANADHLGGLGVEDFI